MKNMNKVTRFFNQNRLSILAYVLVIVFIISIIQILNYYAKQEKIKKNRSNENVITEQSIYEKQSKPIISGSSNTVKTSDKDKYGNLLDNFLTNCVKGNYKKAYQLLSNNCKKILYPTYDKFYELYCKDNFDKPKTYSFQLWQAGKNNIYQIKIMEDMLAKGTMDNMEYIEDYYTIVNENDDLKLNIDKYIISEEINKSSKEDGIEISVQDVDIYKNYSIYTININNDTNKTILLDSQNKDNTLFINNSKGTRFIGLLYENLKEDFVIKPGEEKTIKIKFNYMYMNDNKIKEMKFKDIILDYYKYLENKERYTERKQIIVEI